jgi:hypothetical protein
MILVAIPATAAPLAMRPLSLVVSAGPVVVLVARAVVAAGPDVSRAGTDDLDAIWRRRVVRSPPVKMRHCK